MVRDGSDWLIPIDDPQLLAGPKPLLKVAAKPASLSAQSYREIATDYVANYLTEFEHFRALRPPPDIRMSRDFGFQSKLQEMHYRFFFVKHQSLEKVLADEILPFMKSTAKASRVVPLKIGVLEQYGILALAKIAYLTNEFGFDEGRKLLEKDAMSSVLPGATEVLSYVQGLLSFTPLASTLPLDRMASQLHFFAEGGPWLFPLEALRGIFDISEAHTLPMCEIGRPPFIELAEHTNLQYFFLAVESMNRFLQFLNDPRNFTNKEGEFDLNRFLKTQSAVHFMFADLLAINHTPSVYLHARIALSFMDKLANLKATLSGQTDKEDAIFKSLYSLQSGESVARILSHHGSHRNEKLGKALKRSAEEIFMHMHSRLGAALPHGPSEQDRLELIRTFRNTTHGSFLRASQFEKAFVSSAAKIPPTLAHVPLLYAWALVLEPIKILTV